MPIAYLMSWTEFERGWGNRPDGTSLHASLPDWEQYFAAYRAKLSKEVPDEYSTPDSDKPVGVEIDQVLAARLSQEKSLRFWKGQLVVEQTETGARFAREKDPVKPKTFVELCLEKKASPEDIDSYVELWHTGAAGVGQELREYLGMTRDEYAEWMKDPASLYKTLYARMTPAK